MENIDIRILKNMKKDISDGIFRLKSFFPDREYVCGTIEDFNCQYITESGFDRKISTEVALSVTKEEFIKYFDPRLCD